MSSNNQLALPGGNLPTLGQLSDKLQRQIEQAVGTTFGGGIVAAAQVQTAAFVTHTTLTQVAMLSAEEAALSAADPISADRYAAVVNDFVFAARSIIRGMGS